jgi:hypothetical protein
MHEYTCNINRSSQPCHFFTACVSRHNGRVNTLNQKHLVVERFEDKWAVLEVDAETTFPVPRSWLPADIVEGDVLSLNLTGREGESSLRFTHDPEATADLKARVREARAKRSVPKAPPGNIEI